MTHPSGNQPALPNFQGGAPQASSPAVSYGAGRAGDEPPRRRSPWPLVLGGCCAIALALLLVAGVVLALTMLRPTDDPSAGGGSPTSQEPTAEEPPADEERTRGEYVPEGEEPTEEPSEQVTHLPAPTEQCEYHEDDQDGLASGPTRTSGDLTFTVPEGWGSSVDWDATMPYATDVESADRPTSHDEHYYSVAMVGQATWSDAQGGYPGAEAAATAYLQCHLFRPEAVDTYGEDPELSAFVSEALEVGGHPGWIARGTVDVSEAGVGWDSVEIVAVVVETPSGPAAFKVSASGDDPQLMEDVQSMVDSLTVG